MVVYEKGNGQAAENELTELKETLRKALFQQKLPLENQKGETPEATAEKSEPKS
jgi:hypothetical protein